MESKVTQQSDVGLKNMATLMSQTKVLAT